MNIIRKFFNLLYKLRYSSITENRDRLNRNSGLEQNNISISLKDLKRDGWKVEKVFNEKKVSGENLIYASQLPVHVFPWIVGMKSGIYAIKFPPEIQSQISSGVLNVTGGVARNQSGQVIMHGMNAMISSIFLYQAAVVAFGAYHLQKINHSLEKINQKLDKISSFLLDKRSSEIEGFRLELSHISKGIIEFQKLGNITEVLTRIDFIRYIRIKNFRNLLHLEKTLTSESGYLKKIKRESWFFAEKENEVLKSSIDSYETALIDYSYSLLVDIFCTKIETMFSLYLSYDEVKSRLTVQKNQTQFLQDKLSEFDTTLKKKLDELIIDSMECDEKKKKRKRDIKKSWKQIKENISKFDQIYKEHIQTIEDKVKLTIEDKINPIVEDKVKSKNNIIYLKIDSQKYKKSA